MLRRSTPSRHNQCMSTLRFIRQSSALVVAAAVLALAGCATSPTGDTAPPAGPAATAPLPPSGEVLGQGTVIDVGGEVEFCFGMIMESYPPQCDGIPITNWSWDGVQGSETSGDVTWGAYALVGTYDGKSFSPTQTPIMLALFDPAIMKDPTGGAQGTPCGDSGRDRRKRHHHTSWDSHRSRIPLGERRLGRRHAAEACRRHLRPQRRCRRERTAPDRREEPDRQIGRVSLHPHMAGSSTARSAQCAVRSEKLEAQTPQQLRVALPVFGNLHS